MGWDGNGRCAAVVYLTPPPARLLSRCAGGEYGSSVDVSHGRGGWGRPLPAQALPHPHSHTTLGTRHTRQWHTHRTPHPITHPPVQHSLSAAQPVAAATVSCAGADLCLWLRSWRVGRGMSGRA